MMLLRKYLDFIFFILILDKEYGMMIVCITPTISATNCPQLDRVAD